MLAWCQRMERSGLLEVASRPTLGWSLATADWDGSVYRDHFGEDVEYRLWLVSKDSTTMTR
jgi:hypothetical protein